MNELEMERYYLESQREDEEKIEAYRQYCYEMDYRGELTASIPLDRLQEIIQAEQEGRLVLLPCKVGDTVYVIEEDGSIIESKIIWAFQYTKEEYLQCVNTDGARNYERFAISVDDYCISWFLTRAESEAALKGE